MRDYFDYVGCIISYFYKYVCQSEEKKKKKLKCNLISQPNNILKTHPERLQVILGPLNVHTFAGKEMYRWDLL